MKVTILNGNPVPSGFDDYLSVTQTALTAGGHAVTCLDLRDLPLRHCVGCWGCWVKTPGRCANDGAADEIDRAVINSDFTLWAAPLRMGFPAALLKMAQDKFIPLIHPYILLDHGELHHLKRYERYPRLGLVVEPEPDTDMRDLEIITAVYTRTALNFKTGLDFSLTTATAPAELAARITTPPARPLPLPARLPTTTGITIPPPGRLALFNGSPRGRRGNTAIFLSEFSKGFGGETEMHHLIQVKQMEQHAAAFADAECAWVGFPLYTDAMPGAVKQFFEALQPLVGRSGNPPVGFIVQSGFPEGLHSRYVERYLEKLAARLGSPYLGTIVKGNGEGVRNLPAQANRALFNGLQALGRNLACDGHLDPRILAALAIPERFPFWMRPIFQVLQRLPVAQSYFDGLLKKNGAHARRFDRPFSA